MAMLPRAKGLQLFAMVAAANGKYLHATKSISTKKAIKRNVPFHFKFDGMPMGIISIFSVEIYTIRIVGYLGIAAKNDISLNQIWYDSIGRQPVGRPSVNIIEGSRIPPTISTSIIWRACLFCMLNMQISSGIFGRCRMP